MLLSLPGSPVLYYGDEIGMGDNIWLADRDAVRTPMQWTPDRNAGFSGCDPGRIYLPVVQDPLYGYQAVNVETQTAHPGSLLHWNRRMIHLRREHPAFGLGDYTEIASSNPSVYAFTRDHREQHGGHEQQSTVLCVFNLSRSPQAVELDLSAHAGAELVELSGGISFGTAGADALRLTLAAYGFFWFSLSPIVLR
jgi:maltose alpha-D-glucosyltransferase/alpha-amylase